MEIIDITRGIFDSENQDSEREPKSCFLKSILKGDECNISAFYTNSHCGTHIDAPSHFIEDGMTIDEIDCAAFIGPCRVIKVPEGPITGEYVENNFPRGCKRILVKGNGNASFFDHGAYAAINLGYTLIGTDAKEVGTQNCQIAVHKAFFNNKIGVLEGLDLSEVSEGNYFLIALPMKANGLEAAPARAILIKDSFEWKKR